MIRRGLPLLLAANLLAGAASADSVDERSLEVTATAYNSHPRQTDDDPGGAGADRSDKFLQRPVLQRRAAAGDGRAPSSGLRSADGCRAGATPCPTSPAPTRRNAAQVRATGRVSDTHTDWPGIDS